MWSAWVARCPCRRRGGLTRELKHIKDLDDMMFGITTKDPMGPVYEVGVAHGIKKFSATWKTMRQNTPLRKPLWKCCRWKAGVTIGTERGSTAVYCHSGTGNFLAPMLVCRRKRICNSLKTDAPVGTIFACTDSGWIDSDCFLSWLKHFSKSVDYSMENKHPLLLDQDYCLHVDNFYSSPGERLVDTWRTIMWHHSRKQTWFPSCPEQCTC